MLDSKPPTADDRFAAEDIRVRGDSLQQTIFCFGHHDAPCPILRLPVGIIPGVNAPAKAADARQRAEKDEEIGKRGMAVD
jgi:hypothetical protein